MPALSLGDNVLVTKTGHLYDQLIMSTFGYVITEITGTPSDNTVFGELNAAMCAAGELIDTYNRCCPDEIDLGDIWYQVIRPTRFMKRVKGDVTTGTTSDLPANTQNVASVITRRGALANRKNISSLHVPAPTDGDWMTDGLLTVLAQGKLALLAEACMVTYTTTTGAVKFSPSILNGPLATDVTPIVYAFGHPEVRVMRRRTVGLGK